MKTFALCLLTFATLAAQAPGPWKTYGTNGKSAGSALGTGGDLATVNIPSSGTKLAFLTTTSTGALLGDLTGKTLSATLTLTVTGNPTFVYGLQGTQMNPCPRPANVRLYFTAEPKPFNLSVSQSHEDNYWWSNPISVDLEDLVNNSVTLTVPLDPTQWSNANGHLGSDRVAGFNSAVANVRQIGLGFGGGCFFDNGIWVAPGTGTAVFHLQNYTAQ